MATPPLPPAEPIGDTIDPMRLPDEVQALLLAQAHRRPLAAGQSLFLKGSRPDALFGVVSGCLRVSVAGANGREAVIAMLEPGHWFGEVSLLVGQARVYDTVAVEASEIAIVDAAAFHTLVNSRPDVLMAFTRLVCLRLRQALAWIDDAILMPLPERLASRLLALQAEATGAASATQPASLPLSQEDLAMMLGVSRQSVNRVLRQWEGEGLVALHYGRIELLNAAALARLAAVQTVG